MQNLEREEIRAQLIFGGAAPQLMKVASLLCALVLASCPAIGARPGSAVEYLGGTITTINPHTMGWLVTTDPVALAFQTKKDMVRVPYDRINQIEYGQKAERRVLEGVLLSPLFVLTKKRDHYVTVGFEVEDGRQQVLLFRVEKDDVRALLVGLEARTGRKVSYQDDEARKAGK
jgi:hypothetical protein